MSNLQNSYDFEQAKAEYRDFCEEGTHDIQVFAQPWYLDAVCDSEDDWRVILYKEKDRIIAAFPFEYKKGKHGLWHIRNPWQAPRLGIWIDYQGKAKKSARELLENKIVEDIISKLPYYDEFHIAFDARFQNWQQFYRNGFQQTSYYSYILFGDEDLPQSLSQKTRWQIKSMYEEFHVDEDISLEEYWEFFEKSYVQRGRVIDYPKEKFFRLVQAVMEHDRGHLIACKDASGQIFSEACVFFDSRRLYPMFNTYDTSTKRSTQPLVSLYSFDLAKHAGLIYDFEGSMIPGVANYNMKFNSTQEPYFVITDYSDKYRFLHGLRESSRALKKLIKGTTIHHA